MSEFDYIKNILDDSARKLFGFFAEGYDVISVDDLENFFHDDVDIFFKKEDKVYFDYTSSLKFLYSLGLIKKDPLSDDKLITYSEFGEAVYALDQVYSLSKKGLKFKNVFDLLTPH